ncbi:MAG: phosphate regulon sensor histidine kinase PhoR [Rhodoferax sp.]|nr:phosphate regulon sensor histidine kinase PhoR [Rhodoferax sp.]
MPISIWSRIVSFLLCQSLAALAAWLLLARYAQRNERVHELVHELVFAAALAGGTLWLLLDAMRSRRLLQWLQSADATDLALGQGLWQELFRRIRKLLQGRDRALQQSELRLQEFLAAMQASPNGVVLLDAQGRIEWLNQTAAEHFGLDVERDLLQQLGNLVRTPVFIRYLFASDYHHAVQVPGRNSSSAKPVTLSVQLHPYGEGRRLLLSRDITAVEQAEAMRRDFVANVSHEIRTPLTVLAGFVETLQTLPLDAHERSHYLGLMQTQTERMQSLVNDLLTLSKLEGSPLPATQDWLPLGLLMQQCQQEAVQLSTLLWGKPQDVRFHLDAGLEWAGSAAELHSALSNLIGNAIRYSPADRPIEVNWRSLPQGGAVFSVRDYGPGIAPEHLPRLTERFYRVDRSRSRETGGTGLGLAIAKQVALRHGAELRITSTPGQGSVFSLHFPANRVRQTKPGNG